MVTNTTPTAPSASTPTTEDDSNPSQAVEPPIANTPAAPGKSELFSVVQPTENSLQRLSASRSAAIARSQVVAAAGDLFEVAAKPDGISPELGTDLLRRIAALIADIGASLASVDAGTALFDKGDSELQVAYEQLQAERDALRGRLTAAERRAHELLDQAQELRELKASKVRPAISRLRHAGCQMRAEVSRQQAAAEALFSSATADLARVQAEQAARQPSASLPSPAPDTAELDLLRQKLNMYREQTEDLQLQLRELRAADEKAKTVQETAVQATSAERERLRQLKASLKSYSDLGSVEQLRKDQCQLLSYASVGSLETLKKLKDDQAAYGAMGTPSVLSRRLAADNAMIQMLSVLYVQSCAALRHHEQMLGPVLLAGDRHLAALETIEELLRKGRGSDTPSFDIRVGSTLAGIPISANFQDLNTFSIGSDKAIEVLACRVAEAGGDLNSLSRERDLLVKQLTDLLPFVRHRLPESGLSDFFASTDPVFQSLATSKSAPSSTPAQSTSSSPATTAAASSSSAAAPATPVVSKSKPSVKSVAKLLAKTAAGGKVSTSAKSNKRPSSSTTAESPLKKARNAEVLDLTSSPDVPAVATPRPALRSDRAMEKSATKQEVLEALRASWVGPSTSWPQQPITVLPQSVAQIQRLAWTLHWFADEHVAPNYTQWDTFTAKAGGVRPSLRDAGAWYDTKPWQQLSSKIPKPRTFNFRDPRFTELYVQTLELYASVFKSLWERTHFIMPLPPPPADDSKEAAEQARQLCTQWTTTRRLEKARCKKQLDDHLRRLFDFVCSHDFVTMDLLLDPFFVWPPADGVVTMIPHTGESLPQASERLARAHPERDFFLSAPKTHPYWTYTRLKRVYWLDVSSQVAPLLAHRLRVACDQLGIASAADPATAASSKPADSDEAGASGGDSASSVASDGSSAEDSAEEDSPALSNALSETFSPAGSPPSTPKSKTRRLVRPAIDDDSSDDADDVLKPASV